LRDFASTVSIFPVSCKTEHARVVVEMLRDSKTGSDDDTRKGWTLEDIAHACVGDAHLMLVGNLLEHSEQFLEERPSRGSNAGSAYSVGNISKKTFPSCAMNEIATDVGAAIQ
jgi:hypothetical protein